MAIIGARTALNELYSLVRQRVNTLLPGRRAVNPIYYRNFGSGYVLHSLADILKVNNILGYSEKFSVKENPHNLRKSIDLS